jgi:hypothetical protein
MFQWLQLVVFPAVNASGLTLRGNGWSMSQPSLDSILRSLESMARVLEDILQRLLALEQKGGTNG